jgi:starch synthase
MTKSLRILFLASEAAPLVKTGGLADVVNALPISLKQQGHDVRLAIPCYQSIAPEHRGEARFTCMARLGGQDRFGAVRESRLPKTDVPLYLVEHEGYFNRPKPYGDAFGEYADNLERFCFFSMAALDATRHLDWKPDVVHCHDWHAAPAVIYLKTLFENDAWWKGTPTVFTIHNLGYQGQYDASLFNITGIDPRYFHPDALEFHGGINLMKGGIAFADKINTVSATYAREIQTPALGQGLDGFLRTRRKDLTGIVNGIHYSQWDPAHDPHLAANYSAEEIRKGDGAAKLQCKRALLEQLALPDCNRPLIAMVTRLVWDKGIDLAVDALDRILDDGAMLAILGSGDSHYELALEQAAARRPDDMSVVLGYNEPLAHQMYAGADFFLMPSQKEPCGLSQMYSLAYGTAPIVRRTGGLADTVEDATAANLAKGKATGIVFRPPTAHALQRAVERALRLYDRPEDLRSVQSTGMACDNSWDRASREYVALYRAAMGRP